MKRQGDSGNYGQQTIESSDGELLKGDEPNFSVGLLASISKSDKKIRSFPADYSDLQDGQQQLKNYQSALTTTTGTKKSRLRIVQRKKRFNGGTVNSFPSSAAFINNFIDSKVDRIAADETVIDYSKQNSSLREISNETEISNATDISNVTDISNSTEISTEASNVSAKLSSGESVMDAQLPRFMEKFFSSGEFSQNLSQLHSSSHTHPQYFTDIKYPLTTTDKEPARNSLSRMQQMKKNIAKLPSYSKIVSDDDVEQKIGLINDIISNCHDNKVYTNIEKTTNRNSPTFQQSSEVERSNHSTHRIHCGIPSRCENSTRHSSQDTSTRCSVSQFLYKTIGAFCDHRLNQFCEEQQSYASEEALSKLPSEMVELSSSGTITRNLSTLSDVCFQLMLDKEQKEILKYQPVELNPTDEDPSMPRVYGPPLPPEIADQRRQAAFALATAHLAEKLGICKVDDGENPRWYIDTNWMEDRMHLHLSLKDSSSQRADLHHQSVTSIQNALSDGGSSSSSIHNELTDRSQCHPNNNGGEEQITRNASDEREEDMKKFESGQGGSLISVCTSQFKNKEQTKPEQSEIFLTANIQNEQTDCNILYTDDEASDGPDPYNQNISATFSKKSCQLDNQLDSLKHSLKHYYTATQNSPLQSHEMWQPLKYQTSDPLKIYNKVLWKQKLTYSEKLIHRNLLGSLPDSGPWKGIEKYVLREELLETLHAYSLCPMYQYHENYDVIRWALESRVGYSLRRPDVESFISKTVVDFREMNR